jgi:hypothetical protein
MITTQQLTKAANELATVWRELAAMLEDSYSIEMQAVPSGHPETYEQLAEAWDKVAKGGDAKFYLVWSGGCEDTIYSNPDDNQFFRFVHDHAHWSLGVGFTRTEELYVHKRLKDRLYAANVSALALDLYDIDTTGQTIFSELNGGAFVSNQRLFAHSRVTNCPTMEPIQRFNYLTTGRI